MFMRKPGNRALQLHFAPALFQPDMFLAGLISPSPFAPLLTCISTCMFGMNKSDRK